MTPCLRFKDGVVVAPMTEALARLLAVYDQGARRLQRDITVTCGREAHPATDPHTLGRAIDTRTKDLSEAQLFTLIEFVRGELGADFTVLYESPVPVSGLLAKYAYVNPHATEHHMHSQVKIGLPWPS